MADEIIPVQDASFKGIYTSLDPFTPGPILWSEPRYAGGNLVENTAGRVFIIVRNRSIVTPNIWINKNFQSARLYIPPGPAYLNPEFGSSIIALSPGSTNIFGTFSENFEEPITHNVSIGWNDNGAPSNEIDVAAIRLPSE